MQGIGLPLDEALRFWRTEFSQKTPPDAFDKQYAYNIRHNYGKEGKRVEYTPHSCVKIISSVPGQVSVWGLICTCTLNPDVLNLGLGT